MDIQHKHKVLDEMNDAIREGLLRKIRTDYGREGSEFLSEMVVTACHELNLEAHLGITLRMPDVSRELERWNNASTKDKAEIVKNTIEPEWPPTKAEFIEKCVDIIGEAGDPFLDMVHK